MIRFRLFGIPITILPWFWITMLLIGSIFIGDIKTPQDFFGVLLFVIAGFFSILVHELGHGLTIRKLGADTQIVLQAFGGFATYPQNKFSRPQDFLITAAGPLAQLILGGIVLIISLNIPIEGSLGNVFLKALYMISFVWALFNLVPVFPLDGGQLLNAVLGPKRKNITHIIGIIIAIAVGILGLMSGRLFVAFFMGYFAYQNFQILRGPKT
ncbi:MAG: M50 family metallopeptidase [Roseibacillus sp.]